MNAINSIFKSTILVASIALAFAVAPVIAMAHDTKAAERSAGEVLDDATITASVKTALLDNVRTKGFDINVDTSKGHVTLKGGADSELAKTAATQIATMASGVVSVDNQLVVAAAGTDARQQANRATASGEVRNAMDETGDVVDDSWITGKVKSQLLASSEVSGLAINVDTKDNVVSLTGTVPTNNARTTAIQIATSTKGVKGVNSDLLVVAIN